MGCFVISVFVHFLLALNYVAVCQVSDLKYKQPHQIALKLIFSWMGMEEVHDLMEKKLKITSMLRNLYMTEKTFFFLNLIDFVSFSKIASLGNG